jgi:hypothetical protein
MTGVDTIARIRFEHYQNGKGIKRIARELGVARALRGLRQDEPRVRALLESVASLEGPRHAAQVAEAKALLHARP